MKIDLPGASEALNPAPSSWIPWMISLSIVAETRSNICSGKTTIGPDHAAAPVESGGCMIARREASETTFLLPSTLPTEVLIQPLLSFTAIVAARWRGLLSFHAGAFELSGRAWGILGEKSAGKSTLLAALARGGHPVIADDVLILQEGNCLAGPRCIDLRASSAPYFPGCRSLGVIGERERWRLKLDTVEPTVPLAGWITLEWGATDLARVAWADRIDALKRNFAILRPPVDAAGLLEVAALPMLRFSREQDLKRIDSTAASLHSMLEAFCRSSTGH